MARKPIEPNPDDPKSFRYKITEGFDQIGQFREGDVCEWYEVAQDLNGLRYLLTIGAVTPTDEPRNVGVGANAPTSELKDEVGRLKSALNKAEKDLAEKSDELGLATDELEELRGNVENVEWLETKLAELKAGGSKSDDKDE